MSDLVPPPDPVYMHPDLFGKGIDYQPDGSAWTWLGDRWELVDPPGTHVDQMRRAKVVLPIIDVALRAVKAGTLHDEAIDELRAIPGVDAEAIAEAEAHFEKHSDTYGRRTQPAIALLKRARLAVSD